MFSIQRYRCMSSVRSGSYFLVQSRVGPHYLKHNVVPWYCFRITNPNEIHYSIITCVGRYKAEFLPFDIESSWLLEYTFIVQSIPLIIPLSTGECSLSQIESAESSFFLLALEHEVVIQSCIVVYRAGGQCAWKIFHFDRQCSCIMPLQSMCHRKEAIKSSVRGTHVYSAM